MSKQVKIINARAKVDGEFGGIYPQARVAFFEVFKNSQEYMGAKEGDVEYTDQQNYIESISYRANCWPNEETRVAGYKSRPVDNPDPEDNEENIFVIDVTKQNYKSILERQGDSWDSVLTVVESHYRTEVANK